MDFISVNWWSPWNGADVVGIVLAILLSALGIYLGWRQSKIIREFENLQKALSEVQIREKLGCIRSNRLVMEQSVEAGNQIKVIEKNSLITQDCLSALPLYEFAPKDLKNEYAEEINKSLSALDKVKEIAPEITKKNFSLLIRKISEKYYNLKDKDEEGASFLFGAVNEFHHNDYVNALAEKKE